MITEIKPNSVEMWAVEFSKFIPQKLDDYTMNVWITCSINESKMESDPEVDKVLDSPNEFQCAISTMLKSYPYTMTKAAILAMSFLVKSFGDIRMILSYMQYKLYKLKRNHIDMTLLSIEIFPMGFPSHEFMSKMWDTQKYKGTPDNMLDYKIAYESIKLNKYENI